jgi:hypothetical protein
MNVKRKLCLFANNTDDPGAKGNIVHEMTVHDVAMNPVGTSFLDPPDFVSQAGKIGGEDGWSDEHLRHAANVQRSTLNVQR